ncbi:hypothetical protein SH528x_001109 [Novipirellula sp. SH528]|uniref:hypothetical protein n=1 Tax=Novipirellula sp. SH528 TaxID=3454466 RepID=UPI003FA176A5
MTTPPSLNPYAATIVDEVFTDFEDEIAQRKPFSSLKVCFDVALMIGVSGGLFGWCLIGFVMLTSLFSSPGMSSFAMLGSMFFGALLYFLIGALLALLAAIPVVTLSGWLLSMREPRVAWTPTSIRVFGSVTGAMSGFSCLAIPGLLSGAFQVLGFSLVPAAFAAVTVPLLLFRTVRQCREDLDWRVMHENGDVAASPFSLPPVDSGSGKLP